MAELHPGIGDWMLAIDGQLLATVGRRCFVRLRIRVEVLTRRGWGVVIVRSQVSGLPADKSDRSQSRSVNECDAMGGWCDCQHFQ